MHSLTYKLRMHHYTYISYSIHLLSFIVKIKYSLEILLQFKNNLHNIHYINYIYNN